MKTTETEGLKEFDNLKLAKEINQKLLQNLELESISENNRFFLFIEYKKFVLNHDRIPWRAIVFELMDSGKKAPGLSQHVANRDINLKMFLKLFEYQLNTDK